MFLATANRIREHLSAGRYEEAAVLIDEILSDTRDSRLSESDMHNLYHLKNALIQLRSAKNMVEIFANGLPTERVL